MPDNEIDHESDIWKKFEGFKDHYDHLQQDLEHEEFGKYQNDDVHFLLARLEDNQNIILDELHKITRGSSSSSSSSSGGGASVDNAVIFNRFDELEAKIKTLTDHITSLTDVVRTGSTGTGSSSSSGSDHKPILDKLQELNSETNRRIASLEDAAAKTGKRTSDIHDQISSLTKDPIKTGVQYFTFTTVLWWILGLLVLEVLAYGIYRYYQLKKDDSFKKFI